MKSILKTILLAGSMSLSLAVADEGMWRPQQMPEIGDNLKKLGFKSDPKILSDLTAYPMNAVVSLGGCTASFVSPKGLTVTNHHCAYGSIQYNSKEDNNLLENGFLAKNFGEELPAAPGSRIYVTTAFTNVTDKVTGGLAEGVEPRQRYQAIEDRRKALVKACEEDKGYRCSVASYHGGLEYYLIKKLEIRDVRLVYAPPSSVGKYGGDIDNWRWPRHTGDFSFYRAYVSPDGKAADYSADNVPYEPKSYLKVQPEGVKDDDFVMVAGYPGRTNRYRRLAEVDHAFAWRYVKNGKMEGWDESLYPEATHLIKRMLESNENDRPSAAEASEHPSFWSNKEKVDFLEVVGNQKEFTCPRSKRHPSSLTQVEQDLEKCFRIIVKHKNWDSSTDMNKIYHEMKRRRKYKTSSAVELVRFIRNTYEHYRDNTFATPKPIEQMLFDDFVFLKCFPDLVIEVYKPVTTYGWDKARDDIKCFLNNIRIR